MTDNPIQSIQDILAMMDPEVHMNLKTAVELGKWPDGRRLTPEQLEYSLQAIIAYEQLHLPEAMRVGFIDRTGLKKTHCEDDTPAADQAQPIHIMTSDTLKH
jgi:uncharacterized protein